MKRIKTMILDFLFPPRCAICGTVLDVTNKERRLCPICKADIPFIKPERCQICGRHITEDFVCQRCKTTDFAFTKGVASFPYAVMQAPIANLKFHGYRHDAENLSSLFYEYFYQNQPDWITWTDILTIVPLHENKQKQRGFNQVDLLCRELVEKTNMCYIPDLLQRSVDTVPQSSLQAEQRRENIRNVFVLQKNIDITEKHILLIDDIFTTGSTLHECSKALLRGGAAEVRVYCLAVVEHDVEKNATNSYKNKMKS